MLSRNAEAEIGLCLLFAAVDGEISEEELGALSDRIGRILGANFDVIELPQLLDRELAALARAGVDDYVASLPDRIPEEHRLDAVRAACLVAAADGLSSEEEETVRHVCRVLELDADEITAHVGARNDTITPDGDSHDDEPNDATHMIRSRLVPAGWVDPMQAMRDAGIGVSGFGALALQYETTNGHLLRVEHHTCDGSIHLHVTNEEDTGSDLVIFADGNESDVLNIIEAMKDVVTLESLEPWISRLLTAARVCIFQGRSLIEVERPS